MSTKRTVISQSVKKKKGNFTEQVVYHSPAGTKTNGKPGFKSVTKHEIRKK